MFTFRFSGFRRFTNVFRRNSVSNDYFVACEFVCFLLVLRRNASPAVHLLTSSTRLFSTGFRTKSNPDHSFPDSTHSYGSATGSRRNGMPAIHPLDSAGPQVSVMGKRWINRLGIGDARGSFVDDLSYGGEG